MKKKRTFYVQDNDKPKKELVNWKHAKQIVIEKAKWPLIGFSYSYDCAEENMMYVNILTTAAPKARVISLRRPTEINSIEIPSNLDNHVIQPRNIAVKKKIVDGLIGLCSKGQIPSRYHDFYKS